MPNDIPEWAPPENDFDDLAIVRIRTDTVDLSITGNRVEPMEFPASHPYGTRPGDIGYHAAARQANPPATPDPALADLQPVGVMLTEDHRMRWPAHEPHTEPNVPANIQANNPGRTWLTAEKGEPAANKAFGEPTQPIFEGMRVPDDDLETWWVETARLESGTIAAKMREYGGNGRARDLIEIGRDLYDIAGRTGTEAQYAEAGIYFYLRGKMSRWTAAMMEGRAVSDDTLYDIGVYVRMAQRIRATGGWPI